MSYLDTLPTVEFVSSSRGYSAVDPDGQTGSGSTLQAALAMLTENMRVADGRPRWPDGPDCPACDGAGDFELRMVTDRRFTGQTRVALTRPIRIECERCLGTGSSDEAVIADARYAADEARHEDFWSRAAAIEGSL